MTTHYALCTFSTSKAAKRAGIVVDERIWAIEDLSARHPGSGLKHPGATVLTLLEHWSEVLAPLDQLAAFAARSAPEFPGLKFGDCRIHPPVDLPRQVFCTGANYRKHVIDLTVDAGAGPKDLDKEGLRRWAANMMDERARSGEPYVFTKPVSTVCGAYDPIELPANTKKPDWELELGVVIGTGGFHIPREDAFSHVAGYAIVNDLTARDLIAREDYKMLGADWLKAKGQKGFLPFGPYIVPAHLIANPQNLRIRLTVSGQLMQNESSSDMIFGIARQIEYISKYTCLMPGDLICTGSPAGNGTHYNRYLQDGDVVVGQIEGLGEQRANCVGAK